LSRKINDKKVKKVLDYSRVLGYNYYNIKEQRDGYQVFIELAHLGV
jgi:hypothetical protein